MNPAFARAAADIVAAGRSLAARGLVPATSGNFSARVDERHIAITASGRDKGGLETRDVLLFDLESGEVVGDGRASAETPLHASLYRRRPEIRAVLHTHSRNATVLTMLPGGGGELVLEGYELLKAFRGITTHHAVTRLPVFANDQDMAALSARIEARLEAAPEIHAYLLAGHGAYAWGLDMDEALRHIEALEFLLDCELTRMRLQP